jgi:hypothetical protein
MDFAIPLANIGSAAPANGIVGDVPLWTLTTCFALGIEILWIAGALGFLFWLTMPRRADQSRPKRPTRKGSNVHDDDGSPPLAA